MPTSQRSGSDRDRAGAAPATGRRREADGLGVTLQLRELEARGDRAAVLAEDAGGHVLGHACYRRVYGPRAQLTIGVDDRLWPSRLPGVLVASICAVAAGHGISTLLLSAADSDERLRALVATQSGAREVRSGDTVDLEIATDLAVWPARAGARNR